MKKKWILSILTICFAFGSTALPAINKAAAAEQTVLATTFPIYQIVRNVTQGQEGLNLDLMLPSHLGCPHDYALTPEDMKKLAKADILVVNGLGLEEFLGAPVKRANDQIKIINSSTGIKKTIQYSEDPDHEGDDHEGHDDHGHHHAKEDEAHDEEEQHNHGGPNPHLFASPRMTALLAMNIAAELSKLDPKGAATYAKNAKAYAETMNKLADDMAELGKKLKNNRIIQPHGIFDYLARDIDLEIIAVMQAHGQEPSASEMVNLVKTIKKKNVGAIFTEPQYPDKVGKTLAKETGVPVAMLDPGETGPENAPLSYYETVMRQNMKTLEATLGTK